MGQLQKKRSEATDTTDKKKEALKAAFEAEKQNKIDKHDTRTVSFKVAVGCGCGGNFEWYHGEVPIDSDIKDGDRFYHMPEEVEHVQRGRYDDY